MREDRYDVEKYRAEGWPEASLKSLARFGSPAALLYPFVCVPGGVSVRAHTRGGERQLSGTLIDVFSDSCRVVLAGERETVPDSKKKRPVSRWFPTADVRPSGKFFGPP